MARPTGSNRTVRQHDLVRAADGQKVRIKEVKYHKGLHQIVINFPRGVAAASDGSVNTLLRRCTTKTHVVLSSWQGQVPASTASPISALTCGDILHVAFCHSLVTLCSVAMVGCIEATSLLHDFEWCGDLQQVERPVLVRFALHCNGICGWKPFPSLRALRHQVRNQPGHIGFSPDAEERVPEIDWGIVEERSCSWTHGVLKRACGRESRSTKTTWRSSCESCSATSPSFRT